MPEQSAGHEARQDVAQRHQVTLMVRAECPACETALADVREVCSELATPWHTQDVDEDPELRAEYGDRVPVILIDDVEHGYWKVEKERFRSALCR